MKNPILMLLIVMSLNSFGQSQTETQKAKIAARAYLMKNLNNPKSYLPANWSKLSKTYTYFDDSYEAVRLKDSIAIFKEGKDKANALARNVMMNNILDYDKNSSYLYYKDLEKQADSIVQFYNLQLEKKERNFKGTFDGFRIDHSFRARNGYNALVLFNYYFVYNKSFKVIAAGDSDELENRRKHLQAEIDALIKK